MGMTEIAGLKDLMFKTDEEYFDYLEWKRERRYRLTRKDIDFLYRMVREGFEKR